MKARLVSMLIIGVLGVANAAECQVYYYGDNRRIPMQVYDDKVVVQLRESHRMDIDGVLGQANDFRIEMPLRPQRGFYLLEKVTTDPLSTTIDRLSALGAVERIVPAFYMTGAQGERYYNLVFDEINVRFREDVSPEQVQAMIAGDHVEILKKKEGNRYLLRVEESASRSALELANLYHESELTVWAVPNFISDVRVDDPIEDEYFEYQWHLHNAGQTGGTRGVDIRALPAWAMETGSPSITVAIIDDGVESHEDFYSGQLVPGYDANGDGDPSPGPGDKHGECVAGIVAANFNDKGVRGVGNGMPLMPIQIFDDGTSNEELADAIRWAYQHGADILSNSWGFYTPGYWDPDIADAMIEAATQGRGGLGCLVVKSAGNTGSFVTFPGTVDSVLVVGAVNKFDSPTDYTPRSKHVDVVAPSDEIVTIDRMGSYGYDPGDYFFDFGGTSAAAPQASGLGAVLLSADPTLTRQELVDLIRATARDYGTTNWDGAGRIDVAAALADGMYNAHSVTGQIVASTTWPSSPGYDGVYLSGDVDILAGASLTIDPGTTIYFAVGSDDQWAGQDENEVEFEISGIVDADAGGSVQITFRSAAADPAEGDWDGIHVTKGGSGVLRNCAIRDAEYGLDIYTREEWSDYPCVIEDCEFSNMETYHIRAEGASQNKPWVMDPAWAHITNCTFDVDCPYCLYCIAPAESVIVRDCTIIGSNFGSYGVYVDSPEWIPQGYQRGPQIIGTHIDRFMTGTGVYLPKRTEVTISGGQVFSNKWGVLCEDEGSVVVDGGSQCTVCLCTTGIETRDESDAVVTGGNWITNCTRGLYAKDVSSGYFRDTVFMYCYLYAVEATSQAVPDLGAEPDGGNNSFYAGAECGTYKHVKAKLRYPGLGPVMAEGNWWGSDPPDPDCFSAGTVDYDPWLSSDPNGIVPQEMVQLVLQGIPADVGQNYPNPFSHVTSVAYSVPKSGTRAVIQVFDVKGRSVRKLVDRKHDMGRHSVTWDGLDDWGRPVSSGVYFLRIQIGDDFNDAKKMILWR